MPCPPTPGPLSQTDYWGLEHQVRILMNVSDRKVLRLMEVTAQFTIYIYIYRLDTYVYLFVYIIYRSIPQSPQQWCPPPKKKNSRNPKVPNYAQYVFLGERLQPIVGYVPSNEAVKVEWNLWNSKWTSGGIQVASTSIGLLKDRIMCTLFF